MNLTSVEIDQLVKCQNPLTSLGCRNIAILVLLLDTGIRVSELCGLQSEDAHIEEGYLKVMGKGSKERLVPIGGLAQKMLWRYIIHFRPETTVKADDYLFHTLGRGPLKPSAIKLLTTTQTIFLFIPFPLPPLVYLLNLFLFYHFSTLPFQTSLLFKTCFFAPHH